MFLLDWIYSEGFTIFDEVPEAILHGVAKHEIAMGR